MNTEELLQFILENVPNFTDPEILHNGIAYHYTMHSNLIEATGHFLGKTIDEDIDRTQMTIESIPGNDPMGVIFAYENIDSAIEEGFILPEDNLINKIYEISFISAIRSNHQQEVDFTDADATLIIIANEIVNYRIVYPIN